jgi:hypothetical protein
MLVQQLDRIVAVLSSDDLETPRFERVLSGDQNKLLVFHEEQQHGPVQILHPASEHAGR